MPPPVTGQSLAVKTLYDSLVKDHNIKVININKESLKSGLNSFGRIGQIIRILFKVWKNRNNNDLIYFTLAESFAGNMKDLLIYQICSKNLNKIVVHMLGGAGMRTIVDKGGIQFKLNRKYINQLGGVIVEGQKQAETFSKLIQKDKIHIIPNFAEDFLFAEKNDIQNKFSDLKTIKILFLSNLIYGKGYLELIDAFVHLDDDLKRKTNIVFVGGFESDRSKTEFFKKIEGIKEISYYGTFVSGIEKKSLYNQSHIFCLPTYYPYEGQPISILEAYAMGCVVITTDHSGIPEVFSDEINGFLVEKMSSESLKSAMEKAVMYPNQLLPLALSNSTTAREKYRTSIFIKAVTKAFEELISS